MFQYSIYQHIKNMILICDMVKIIIEKIWFFICDMIKIILVKK
jgi:hypothetical protein